MTGSDLPRTSVTSIGGPTSSISEPAARYAPAVRIAIDSLRTDLGLRSDGVRQDHVVALAELQDQLPPIVVQRETMRIVDGLHRLRAAQLRGRSHILVWFIDANDVDALLVAIELNGGHGLPLSRRDRRSAVQRLLKARPHWSDRRIAALVGVDHKTVGSVRRQMTGEIPHVAAVVGLDGRERRIRHVVGTDYLPAGARAPGDGTEREGVLLSPVSRDGVTGTPRRGSEPSSRPSTADVPRTLEALRADPALRYTSAGRMLLGTLSATLEIRDLEGLAAAAPRHCSTSLAALARSCALRWLQVAHVLDQSAEEE